MTSVALPSTPSPRLEWTRRHAVERVLSPFTGEVVVYSHGADWWDLRMYLPPMRPATAAAWFTWVDALVGGLNTFPLAPPGQSAALEFRLLEPIGWSENPAGTLVLFKPITARGAGAASGAPLGPDSSTWTGDGTLGSPYIIPDSGHVSGVDVTELVDGQQTYFEFTTDVAGLWGLKIAWTGTVSMVLAIGSEGSMTVSNPFNGFRWFGNGADIALRMSFIPAAGPTTWDDLEVSIAAPEFVAFDTLAPAPGGTVTATAVPGAYSYRWVTAIGTGNYSNVSGATALTLDVPADAPVGTLYRLSWRLEAGGVRYFSTTQAVVT